MDERYKKPEEDHLYRMAFTLYHKAMETTHNNISDTAAVFTVCLALCFEEFDKEHVQEALHVTNKNFISIWEYFQALKSKYKKSKNE